MSDAVMVPREPTEAMAAAYDETQAETEYRVAPASEVWSAMLAASPSVGGWEDISTAPKDGTVFLARSGDWTPFECEWDGERFVHMDPEDGPIAYKPDQWHPLNRCPTCNGFGFLDAPPPPSVSIDNGSRPQEAVPTEQAAPPVVGWLIEKEDGGLFFRMATRWTRDASEALRFSRQCDAQEFASAFEGGQFVSVQHPPYRIAEHRWG